MTLAASMTQRQRTAGRVRIASLAHGIAHEVTALRSVEHGLGEGMAIADVRRMLDRMIRERQAQLLLIGGEGGNA